MAHIRVKHNISEINNESMELVLEDTSVLDSSEDLLVNSSLLDINKGKINQHIKNITRSKGLSHSYNPDNENQILSKYDAVKEEVGFQVNLSSPPLSEVPSKPEFKVPSKKPTDFIIPKKRMRIVDVTDSESRSEASDRYEKSKTLRKVPKISEEESFEEISAPILHIPKIIKSTPITEEGEEFTENDDLFIKPPSCAINPQLSLKDTGSTSVVFVPLPTERIQKDCEINAHDQWKDRERPYGRGLAACLEMLRAKKELGGNKKFGRHKDEDGNDDLAYYDKKGRVLTKKQAFRQQNYYFHNQRPGQEKLKKLEIQEEIRIKELKTDPAKGTQTLKTAKSIMDKTKSPFVVISKL